METGKEPHSAMQPQIYRSSHYRENSLKKLARVKSYFGAKLEKIFYDIDCGQLVIGQLCDEGWAVVFCWVLMACIFTTPD